MAALRKITIMPARRLEGIAPTMKNKGRIRIGADADLTVFDKEKVTDRATYERPNLPSEGMRYVLVGGVLVVQNGTLKQEGFPGSAVRAPIRSR